MKTLLKIGLLVLVLPLHLTSCNRSRSALWEDTKTCGRYMNKGVRSFFGQHVDPREYAQHDAWNEEIVRETEKDYIPLAGMQDTASFAMQEYTPPSAISPGDPGSQVPGIDAFYSPQGDLAAIFNPIRFATDKYTIASEESLAMLSRIANYLAKHPHIYVFVEGHTDERGAAAYNLALGSRRANAVRTFLIQNGVSPDQLFTISYGLERPALVGHDALAWEQNRRAQFKVYER